MSRYRKISKKLVAAECEKMLVKYQNSTADTEKQAKSNFQDFQDDIAILTRIMDVTTAISNARSVAYQYYVSQCKELRQ